MKLDLTVVRPQARVPLNFELRRMVNAGFVGRDQAAVKAHIAELAREGIAPPPSVRGRQAVLREAVPPV